MTKKSKPAGERFSKFDVADYLETSEDVLAYLSVAAEGGDAAHFSRALGTVARARNMSELARKTGLTREGLYKALSGEGNPSLDTAMRVLASLGCRMSVVAEAPNRTASVRRAKAKAA